MGTPQQLTLTGITTPDAPAGPRVFVRGVPVDRTGPARYVHLIRDLNDPERTERPIGGRVDRSPHLTLADIAVTTCREEILGLLADGRERTFNAIGVELLDHTADTLLGSPYDDALWQLVKAEQLEHTMEAPVLFRRTQVSEGP
jgi:hypothetical protein